MDNIQYVAFNEYDAPVSYEEAGGDGFKQVMSFVVPLLIPIAGPMIGAAIGLSGSLAGTVGGALMGAANSAITGGDVGVGALTGGLGGFQGAGGFGGPQVADAANGANAGLNTVNKASQIAANGSKAMGGFATPSFTVPGMSNGGLTLPPGLQRGVGVSGMKPLADAVAPAASGAAAELGVGQRVLQSISRLGGQVVERMGGMDRALATITQMAMTGARDAQMQDAIDARRAELDAERASNQRLFDHRMAVSNRILGEAAYHNPEEGGSSAALDYTKRVNNQEEEALRDLAGRGGYNTGQRENISRRAGLARGRGSASAFLEGSKNAEERRGQRRTEALQWLPAAAPGGDEASQLALLRMQDEATGRRDRDYGQAFGFGTADVYQPNEEPQWDQVGLWGGGRI